MIESLPPLSWRNWDEAEAGELQPASLVLAPLLRMGKVGHPGPKEQILPPCPSLFTHLKFPVPTALVLNPRDCLAKQATALAILSKLGHSLLQFICSSGKIQGLWGLYLSSLGPREVKWPTRHNIQVGGSHRRRSWPSASLIMLFLHNLQWKECGVPCRYRHTKWVNSAQPYPTESFWATASSNFTCSSQKKYLGNFKEIYRTT